MLRPENWIRPTGENPVRVIAGEPGSRPRFAIERSRAERGVKSLFGGSKRAGRSATRHESCSLVTGTTREPSRSCRGEGPRARMSGTAWAERHIIRYYLHRWPSVRSMKRARARIKVLTARSQVGQELEVIIGRLNPFLRGWGNYFRTGNAAIKFRQLDRYVWWRLFRLLVKKRGRNLRAGQADRWTPAWFHDQGLHQLNGTIRYPKAA